MPRYPKPVNARLGHRSNSSSKELAPRDPKAIKVPKPPQRWLVEKKDGKVRRYRAKWHPEALKTWSQIWSSPMVPEYLEAHEAGLRMLLSAETQYWEKVEEGKSSTELFDNIVRLQKQFGLTPMSLRSMGWIVAQTEEVLSRRQSPNARTRKQAKQVDAVIDADVVDLPSEYAALET